MDQVYSRLKTALGTEVLGLLGFLLAVIILFGLTAPNFLTYADFGSVASQLPALGLLTLAMLVPIISGGFNLAIIHTANMAGLTLAYVLNAHGGVDPFGGFGRVLPVVAAPVVLQELSSGLNPWGPINICQRRSGACS